MGYRAMRQRMARTVRGRPNHRSIPRTLSRRPRSIVRTWPPRPLQRPLLAGVRRRLDAVELGVSAVGGHELFVRTDLHHPRAIQYDDEVGHPDRAEAV